MSRKVVIGSVAVVAVLFVAALIGDGVRRNVSDDKPLVAPQINPHPTERVKLYVTAPPSLNVSLGVQYSVGTWHGWFGPYGGKYCGPYSDRASQAGDPPAARVTVPIALKWDGSAYVGEFVIDHYLPGPCHWAFTELDTLSPVKDFVSLSYETQPTKYNFDTSDSHGIYDQSATQSADRWCGPDPALDPRRHGKILCTSLGYFVTYPGTVSNELLASVPVEQRTHMDMVNIFPYTKSITLRFHDLAAENQAAMASPSAHARLAGKCPPDGVRLYVDADGAILVDGVEVLEKDLLQYLRKHQPSPKVACYAQESAIGRSWVSGSSVVSIVDTLNLPIELFADNNFDTLATLKQ